MSITIQLDAVERLSKMSGFLDDAKITGKKIVETTCEVAEKSGVPKLIRTCNAMKEATDALWKTNDEFADGCRNCAKIYKIAEEQFA